MNLDDDDDSGYVPPTLEQQLKACNEYTMRLSKWHTLMANLDRCPHGRHEGDTCAGWRGPGTMDGGCYGGISLGNPVLQPGAVIGIDYSATQLIRIPHDRADRHDPRNWLVPRGEHELHHFIPGLGKPGL